MPVLDSPPSCYAQRYEGEGTRILDWNAAFIDSYCAAVAAGTEGGSYGEDSISAVRRSLVAAARLLGHSDGLPNSTGVVIGSENPWVECLALNARADTVWTRV